MIDAMITRLLEEANEDAQHEGFCDTEMGKSKVTRNKLNEDIDALTAACDEGKATILRLTDAVTTLSQEVAELENAMAEATAQRLAEKKTNKAHSCAAHLPLFWRSHVVVRLPLAARAPVTYAAATCRSRAAHVPLARRSYICQGRL